MRQLLALLVLPEFEETLSDWLLLRDDVTGFTSTTASGHGSHHDMTISEQVQGWRQQRVYWLEMAAGQSDVLLQALKQDFPHADIHFWLLPLAAQGNLADYGDS